MFRAVLFDLDDTLYPLEQFVAGGCQAVGKYLADHYRADGDVFFDTCMQIYRSRGSTGTILDEALERAGLAGRVPIQKMVEVYRSHRPVLSLYPDARQFLGENRGRYFFGLITDGHPGIQRKKVTCLGLETWLDVSIFTGDRPGWGKPDPRSYLKAVKDLGVLPGETIYIGDNPGKDFSGARESGLATIRLLRGEHRKVEAPDGRDGDYKVENFEQLVHIIKGGNAYAQCL